MSKLKLIMVVLFVVVLGALSGAIYYASTLISPEEVRRLTLQKLEETFPNSKVELGELSFTIGTTFKFDLDELTISSPKKAPKPLFAVEDVHMKVPVWAILFGGGEIDVQVSSPEVFYKTLADQNNWSNAMRGPEAHKTQENEQEQQEQEQESQSSQAAMIVPGFLMNGQLNLKVSDLKVHYQMEEQKGELDIAKFLIRNLNFDSSTAFEIDSHLSFELSESQKVSFDTLVIGQFNLGDYLNNKELPIMAVIKVNNLKTSMLARSLNEIKTDLKVLVKEEEITGHIDIDLLQDGRLSSSFVSTKNKTGLNSIKANIPLQEVLSLIELNLKGFNFNKSVLKVSGETEVLENGTISPKLRLKVTPSIIQNFNSQVMKHKLEASLIEKNFKSKLTSELFSGTMVAKMSAAIDLNKKMTLENLPRFSSSVDLTNLSISKKFIQDTLYSTKEDDKRDEKSQRVIKDEKQGQERPPLALPPGSLSLRLTNINIAGEILSGEGLFELAPGYAATQKLNFTYSGGEGNLTHLTKIQTDSYKHQFDFSLNSFNLSGVQAFLPPSLGAISGDFSMTAKGSAQTPAFTQEQAQFDVVLSANGSKGKAQVLINLEKKINDLIRNIPKLAKKLDSKKPLELDGSFDSLAVRSKLTQKKYEFGELKFIGSGKRFRIDGKGDIYPPGLKKNSVMNFTYKESKGNLVAPLRELTGDNEIPLRLKGPGYNLKPDYGHTAEILLKRALKSQGEKAIKKEAKKIESKLKDELENKGKEKIKNLFGL